MAGTLAAALDRVVKFVDDALWSALLAQEALEPGRDLVARGRRELPGGGVVVGLLLELVEHGGVLRVRDDPGRKMAVSGTSVAVSVEFGGSCYIIKKKQD